jgi:KDO2-lipid IV(A) lauroyltransferase
VGGFFFHVVRIRRRVVVANVRHVFVGMTEAEVQSIACDAFRQFGMFIVEFLRHAVARPGAVPLPLERSDIGGLERLLELKASRRPVIICTPHHTNFDIGCYAYALLGLNVHIVMKAMQSPRVNGLLRRTRETYGHTMVLREAGCMDRLIDLLRAGEWVGILPDQRTRNGGVTVDFLGKPVSIASGAARLHLATGAQIVVCSGQRLASDPRRILVHTSFLPVYTPTEDPDSDSRAIMQAIVDAMSDVIRLAPGQYFWFHRLWGKQVEKSRVA